MAAAAVAAVILKTNFCCSKVKVLEMCFAFGLCSTLSSFAATSTFYCGCCPGRRASLRRETKSSTLWMLWRARVSFFFLVVESAADNQQWAFQHSKRGKAKKNPNLLADYKRGFLSSSGLFKYSRHPNFLAEQCIWFSFYLFSVASLQGGVPSKLSGWFNATIAGPALLSLLFQGSARFTEVISCEKYPEYRHYQATTGMFF